MLRRAIAFEVSSRQIGGGLESDYILCYAGLEAIANELTGIDASIPKYQPAQWKRLKHLLAEALESFGQTHGLMNTLVEYTKKKLPELGRLTIADSLLYHVKTLGLKVDDLWPTSVGFESGVRKALRIRNSLVHRAVVVDPISMHENLVRLQILTERFILKLLNWPEDKTWVWADQTLKRTNRPEIQRE